MKRLLELAVLVLSAFLIFIPTQSPAQVSGGTVIYAAGADPDSLDPANAESNPSEAVNRMMYENLVRFDEKLKIQPGLATKAEQSKDGMAWTFTLRKGSSFTMERPSTPRQPRSFSSG